MTTRMRYMPAPSRFPPVRIIQATVALAIPLYATCGCPRGTACYLPRTKYIICYWKRYSRRAPQAQKDKAVSIWGRHVTGDRRARAAERLHAGPATHAAGRRSSLRDLAGSGFHRPAVRDHRWSAPEVAPGQDRPRRLTRWARSSVVIIGFDTHMIVETMPVLPSARQNTHQAITGHYVTMPSTDAYCAQGGTNGS